MKTLYLKLEDPGKPKHLRIYLAFIRAIRSGTLRAGDPLPSTRELAKLYRCHRFTVMSALQSLSAESWLESAPRSHYFVSEKIPITESGRGPEILSVMGGKKDLPIRLARAKPKFDLERTRYRLEFWGGQPDLRLFPKEEFRKIVSESLRRASFQQLQYGNITGLSPLQKQMGEYLRRTRSLIGKEILICNGSQEALHIIAQTLLKPGDAVAVERKGYPPAWRLFESLGAKLIPITVDEEGMRASELAEVMKKNKVKMIYTTPLHQYPTTVTLSPRRRQELISLAENNRIMILEDDYDYEFHYLGPPPPPLATESRHVIYVCSLSKVLFPGARLGVIACDPFLADHLAYQKYLCTRQTDSVVQLALAKWTVDGGFERHLRRMRRIYEKRYLAILQGLAELQNDVPISWHTPSGGMSVWLDVKKDAKQIANQAKKMGLYFQSEGDMDYRKSGGTHLRIGFTGVTELEMSEGLLGLGKILRHS